MKNPKTTIWGIVIATGTAMQASDNPTVKLIGLALATIGGLLLGAHATDSTSNNND